MVGMDRAAQAGCVIATSSTLCQGAVPPALWSLSTVVVTLLISSPPLTSPSLRFLSDLIPESLAHP